MRRPGFTILELLLATALAAVILVGLIRLHMVVVQHFSFAREVTHTQQAGSWVLKQIMNDLSSAFIPNLEKAVQNQEQGDANKPPEQQTQIDKDKEKEQERERFKNMFVATIDDSVDGVKLDGKRTYPTIMVSFVTTNAFGVYGEQRQRLVRVIYELKKDKARSKGSHLVYQLVRKETPDVLNYSGKPSEEKPVETFVVAENVKGLYVKCSMFKRDSLEEKLAEKHKNDNEVFIAHRWGDIPETQGQLPQFISLTLELWQDDGVGVISFSTAVTIGAYPFVRVDKKAKKAESPADQNQQQPADASQTAQQNNGQQPIPASGPGGTPPTVPSPTGGGS